MIGEVLLGGPPGEHFTEHTPKANRVLHEFFMWCMAGRGTVLRPMVGCAGGAAPQLPGGSLDLSWCLWVAQVMKVQSISVWVQGLEALLLGKPSSCVNLVAHWVCRAQLKTRRVGVFNCNPI